MDRPQVSSEELYRQMANDAIYYLMEDSIYKYSLFSRQTPEGFYKAVTSDTLCIANLENRNIAAEAGSYLLLENLEIQFLKLVPNHRIELLWKLKRWPDAFFCKADIEMTKIELLTLVEIHFLGLPIAEVDATKVWEQDLWRPIREAFTYKEHLISATVRNRSPFLERMVARSAALIISDRT